MDILIGAVILMAALGPSIAIARLGRSLIDEIGKNPSAASRIFLRKIMFLVAAETVGIGVCVLIYSYFAMRSSTVAAQ